MAHIDQVPSEYRDTAKGIPPAVLAGLTPEQATARAVASERLHQSGISIPDPPIARASLHAAQAVLTADPGAPADFRAKAAATTDTVLRSGYYAAAEQAERDNPKPTGDDLAKAQQAINAMSVPRLATPAPVSKTSDQEPVPTMLYKGRSTGAGYYRAQAEQLTDPALRRGYLDLAAKAEGNH